LTRINAAAETERTRHQAEVAQVRAELVKLQAKAEAADQSHQEQRKHAAAEALRAADHLTKIEADRDTARQQANTAREEAAKLAGKLEATQTQATSLMQALGARQEAPEAKQKIASKPVSKAIKQ
jgi:colicin import membrane protein